MLKLSTRFEVVIVVVQVGTVKIHATAMEAIRKKERGGQNRMKLSLPPKKNGAFLSFASP
jgi:hypothetical protein